MASTIDLAASGSAWRAHAAAMAVAPPERFCFGTGAIADRRAVGGGARILIVDTQPHLAALTATMLTDLGYDARWCLDVRDALERLERGYAADLLVLPDECLAMASRALARHPGLRALLTHGSGHRPEPGSPFAHLAKPYSQGRLHRKVCELLDGPAAPCSGAPSA